MSKDKRKKVFILEDSQDRVKEFKKRLEGCDVFITDNVKEAKKNFKENEWDLIFLDHDLGGEAFVDISDPNTGSAFASWLTTQLEPGTSTPIFIHSANNPGARNMSNILKHKRINSHRTPFIWLQSEFEKVISF